MEQSLHYGLLAAHILFQKAFWARVLKEYPALLPGQPKVLDYLMAHESPFQREIADGCLIEAPTLCQILDKMERNGLICRQKSSDNKKNTIVILTEAGRNIGQRLTELFSEMEHLICVGLSPQDLTVLKKSLNQIQANAQEYLK